MLHSNIQKNIFLEGEKKRNGKEKGTEMRNGKKNEKMWNFYENLNTENCLKWRLRLIN